MVIGRMTRFSLLFSTISEAESASLGQRALVEYALRLIDSGMSFEEVVERLEADKGRIRLVALLDTLEYLKKGGRISWLL